MPKISSRAVRFVLLVSLLGLQAGAAVAASTLPYRPTQAEIPLLPGFCKASYGEGNPSDQRYWAEHFGLANWPYMHYFCDGLNHFNRAARLTRNKAMREHYLGVAEQSFDRLLANSTEDFPLRAETHLFKGRALLMKGHDKEALAEWAEASAAKPDLVEAYVAIADYLAGKKEKQRALEIVTEGLRHAPEVKALQRRYDELGGKQPYPEPYPAKAPVETQGTDTPATTASDEAATAQESGQINDPQIGTPENPWCRFCPDTAPQTDPPASNPAASPTGGP